MEKQKTLKVLDKKIIELDGVEIEVELKMIKNIWGDIIFKPHARFFRTFKFPSQILKKKYKKQIEIEKKGHYS